MIKGIDVSAYQINVPWKVLMEHGLQFAIIKGDQMTATANHIALAREAGVPVVGLYFWQDPTINAKVQAEWFANDIQEYKPDFVWLDMEQWWSDWNEWSKLYTIPPQTTGDKVPKFTSLQITNHAIAVLSGLRDKFPDLVIGIYTGNWFIQSYCPDLIQYLKDWPLWMAHYFDSWLGIRNVTWEYLEATPPANFKVSMPNDTLKWKIWQYSSTMISPAQNARYDWNVFDGTLIDLKNFVNKKEGVIMAGTYKESVLQKDRASLLVLSSEDTTVNMNDVKAGVDTLALKIGGQDGPEHFNVYPDKEFKTRVAQVGTTPTLGWFNLDANYPLWVRQFNLDVPDPTKDDFKDRKWWSNETLKLLLQQWRKDGISEIEWTNQKLNITATDGGWNNLKGLIFFINNTRTNPGSLIPGVWQLAVVDDMLKYLNIFMDGGYIPKIPIFLAATPVFLNTYSSDDAWVNGIFGRLTSGQLTGLTMLEVGAFTEVPMATPFETVKEVFNYRPADTFKYSIIPFGTEQKILIHIYSYNRFLANSIKNVSGKANPLMVGSWFDTPTEIAKLLKTTIVEPPIEPPVEPPSDLAARVTVLETRINKLVSYIVAYKE